MFKRSYVYYSQSMIIYILNTLYLVQYHQNRVDSISELERRLESSGYGVGLKMLELITYRNREVRIGSSLISPLPSMFYDTKQVDVDEDVDSLNLSLSLSLTHACTHLLALRINLYRLRHRCLPDTV